MFRAIARFARSIYFRPSTWVPLRFTPGLYASTATRALENVISYWLGQI